MKRSISCWKPRPGENQALGQPSRPLATRGKSQTALRAAQAVLGLVLAEDFSLSFAEPFQHGLLAVLTPNPEIDVHPG